MKRQATRAAARRAGGAGKARIIEVPLPLSGLLVEAKTAEISGLFAAELVNLKSNGVALEVVKSYTYNDLSRTALRRIPFEFSGYSQYIEIKTTRINSGMATLERSVAEDASVGYISSQAVIADGNGPAITFDGTAFTERVWTSDDVDPETLDGLIVHQDRCFFWKKDGPLEFFVGDVGAIEGALYRFPFGRLGNVTGKMRALASLTVDAGNNLNDSLVVTTTTGDLIAYEGLDPTDPEDWRMSARVRTAPPLSKNGFANIGGDVWMITPNGLVSVLESLQKGVLALVGNVSRPVAKGIRAISQTGAGEWQLHVAADGEQVIVNHYLDGTGRQFIYHPENQVWETGQYPAKRWHNLDGRTEFTSQTGTFATLGEAEEASETVTAVWETGWFNLRRASEIKHLRPTIIAKQPLSVRLWVLSDHDETAADIAEAEQTVTIQPDEAAIGSENVALNDIFGVGAVGTSFKIGMEITTTWAEIVAMEAGVA